MSLHSELACPRSTCTAHLVDMGPHSFLKIIPLIVQKIINDSVLPIVKAQIGASGPDQIALSFTT